MGEMLGQALASEAARSRQRTELSRRLDHEDLTVVEALTLVAGSGEPTELVVAGQRLGASVLLVGDDIALLARSDRRRLIVRLSAFEAVRIPTHPSDPLTRRSTTMLDLLAELAAARLPVRLPELEPPVTGRLAAVGPDSALLVAEQHRWVLAPAHLRLVEFGP